MRVFVILLFIGTCSSCSIIQGKGATIAKPKTHKVWPKGHRYLIDLPVGQRHIHLFERKRVKKVNMK